MLRVGCRDIVVSEWGGDIFAVVLGLVAALRACETTPAVAAEAAISEIPSVIVLSTPSPSEENIFDVSIGIPTLPSAILVPVRKTIFPADFATDRPTFFSTFFWRALSAS